MANAEVGDDVIGDDPTVKALEAYTADLLGKEAAVFVPSGTMANLLAVATHCPSRGDEVILGHESHIFYYEQGGASSLMGVAFNVVQNQADGTLNLDQVETAIKPKDSHHATSRLLALENTQNRAGGKVITPEYMAQARALCDRHGLALHVDGARLWNAAAALGVPPRALLVGVDSASVCLSKGLGAPVGSVLVGTAEFVARARFLRKAVGGSMRQAGVLAAAGLFALKENLPKLPADASRAGRLAAGLRALGADVPEPPTNLVYFKIKNAPEFVAAAAAAGVRLSCVSPATGLCRAVVHLQIGDADLERALQALGEAAQKAGVAGAAKL